MKLKKMRASFKQKGLPFFRLRSLSYGGQAGERGCRDFLFCLVCALFKHSLTLSA